MYVEPIRIGLARGLFQAFTAFCQDNQRTIDHKVSKKIGLQCSLKSLLVILNSVQVILSFHLHAYEIYL